MSIFDLFSKRQKKKRGEVPDLYTYTILPDALRVQIVHIWFDTLGGQDEYFLGQAKSAYKEIVDALCREYGLFELFPGKMYSDWRHMEELVSFFLSEEDVEKALDAVELSFLVIDNTARSWSYLKRHDASERADAAIFELNSRFREHGIGYQYTNGEIVRIDSAFLHAEVVKPVLDVLNGQHYAGAQEEFLKAHEHYRHGNEKEALNECLKALESLMKSICDKRNWRYRGGATAKELIQICLENNLIPSFWQSHYSSLRNMLESGVPTGRNKLGGHGQGSAPIKVPAHLVSYMLHMTAASMLFLAEAEGDLE